MNTEMRDSVMGNKQWVLDKFSNISIGINDYSKFENTMNFYEVITALIKTTEKDWVLNSLLVNAGS